jgi:tungstate transport system substrate-binding protein
MTRRLLILVWLCLLAVALPAAAAEKSIVLASTTSTEQSGLFAHILPLFTAKSGIEVKVVAQGTGQAIKTASNGDADVVLVHDRKAEDQFVADGFGVDRRDVMHNDFLIVGPKADPAGIRGGKSATEALAKIAAGKATFVSRGDDSGTHRAELRLWKQASIDPAAPGSDWYREAGSGMGPTLNTASELSGYVLTDRATWASFKNKGDLEPLVEGDAALFNPYGVILVNPQKFPSVKAVEAKAFADWLVSAEGQSAIAGFKVDGAQVFFPDAVVQGTN